MKKYLNVYIEFLRTCFAEALSFRFHFFMLVLLDAISVLIALSSISFLFDHVEKIGPWNKNQLLFFASYMLLVNAIHKCVNSQNFWHLSLYIKNGDLDFILLRPLHSIFTCFFRYFRFGSSLNIILTASIVIYYGIQLNFIFIQWVLIFPLIILSWLFILILEMILATMMFWLQEGNGINFLRIQLQDLGEWPEYIYTGQAKRFFLFVWPVLLVGSAPVHFLYDFNSYHLLTGLIVAIFIFFIILNKLWNRALLGYNSASS